MAAVLTQEPVEESLLWKRLRALQQWYTDLNGKVDTLAKTVQDIGKPVESRGPDPDLEEQRYTQEEVRFLMGTAAQEARRNYGGIYKGGGSNINTVMLTVLTFVLIPGGAWIISTLITHGEQLAQIRCQLSPSSCLQLQVPHAP